MTTTTHTARNQMPDTITGPDGLTYHKTGYTGTTMPACRYGAGRIAHEYWAEVPGFEEDTFRLHAISPTQHWLD